jgi:dCTP deaminase
MSALNANGIRGRLKDQDDRRRLVVSPILDPSVQLGENQAAIDVRLGRVFSIVRPWAHGVGELLDGHGQTPSAAIDTFVLAFGQPLIIHPHQFVLARTLEMVRLPGDLLAYVIGRSSWGRRGLIVATAVVVHPGFAGPITLELRNLGETPIALYPMDRIAQLTFHELSGPGPDVVTAAASQFTASFEPSLGRVRNPDEVRRLHRLAVEANFAADMRLEGVVVTAR